VPSPERIKEVNERYHDVAAASYDSKWGIDFGEIGQKQVTGKLRKALGRWPERPYGDALEIGAGTGYFSLNLMQAGAIARATATDISPGMLATLEANAERLGLSVKTMATDAETLPFGDEGFDLVFGHAVLHHPRSRPGVLGIRPVLRPGGTGLLRRALALWRPGRDRSGPRCSPPLWRRLVTPPPATTRPMGTATTSSKRSMCTPSRPATCIDSATLRASGKCG
jgi:ubiquinone/menaquinone biosynthesis C-methylase UbiE